MTLLAFGAIGPAVTQVTVWPLVVQVLPLLLYDAGAVTPVGRVMVVTMEAVVAPVPLLVTVMGRLLGEPDTKAGAGWPMVVVRSGSATVTPVPLNAAKMVGETESVLETCRLAVLAPALVGVKATATVQLEPPANEKVGVVQVPPATMANWLGSAPVRLSPVTLMALVAPGRLATRPVTLIGTLLSAFVPPPSVPMSP